MEEHTLPSFTEQMRNCQDVILTHRDRGEKRRADKEPLSPRPASEGIKQILLSEGGDSGQFHLGNVQNLRERVE